MHKNPAKGFSRPQLAGLIAGTGLAASIQLALVPPVMPFYEFVITMYFLAGLFSGHLGQKLSWRWGIWLTFPWIAWIFFNIASVGFRDGILLSMVWLVLYSFPALPASAGAYSGAIISRWKRKKNSLLN